MLEIGALQSATTTFKSSSKILALPIYIFCLLLFFSAKSILAKYGLFKDFSKFLILVTYVLLKWYTVSSSYVFCSNFE